MTTTPADLLKLILNFEYLLYIFIINIVIRYFYTSTITTDLVDEKMEATLLTARARKIGSLRALKASVLEQRLIKELPAD